MFKQGHRNAGYEVIADGLPNDASIIDARIDWDRRGIVLIIQSDSFDELHEGELVPLLAPPVMCSYADNCPVGHLAKTLPNEK